MIFKIPNVKSQESLRFQYETLLIKILDVDQLWLESTELWGLVEDIKLPIIPQAAVSLGWYPTFTPNDVLMMSRVL